MTPTGCPDFTVELPHGRGGAVVRAADFGFSRESDTNAAAVKRLPYSSKRRLAPFSPSSSISLAITMRCKGK